MLRYRPELVLCSAAGALDDRGGFIPYKGIMTFRTLDFSGHRNTLPLHFFTKNNSDSECHRSCYTRNNGDTIIIFPSDSFLNDKIIGYKIQIFIGLIPFRRYYHSYQGQPNAKPSKTIMNYIGLNPI